MKHLTAIVAVLVTIVATTSPADEIGYIEEFALAENRTIPLKQLIPGTQDYYYYHCALCATSFIRRVRP